jgi:hypothetical protein
MVVTGLMVLLVSLVELAAAVVVAGRMEMAREVLVEREHVLAAVVAAVVAVSPMVVVVEEATAS